MKEELLQLRNQLKMGHRISFAEAMLLQRAIDILVNKAGNPPAQSDCCPAQNGVFPAQGQGWIPVSEQMPDENAEQQILACFKGGDISALYYSDGRWDDAYGIVPIRQDVTHWMPLPAAPREVK
ncbi:DUF551 domain-containing protein [Klebsiella sp. R19]|uniref:DUF551 domain-containing protein n=1 Tax=Klebsiella sp. R19 TaxID=3409956 RepID=UPI003025CF56|nr:DUF551 domain-containing protein [Klebsiella pneumoniae]